MSNERAALSHVALQPGLSAAQIARETALAPQTVGKMLVGLENQGLVVRGEARRGARGQPATPYFLARDGALAVGCELGWRRCSVHLASIAGDVLAEKHWSYAFPDESMVFDEIAAVVRRLVAGLSARNQKRIVGLAVAAPSGIALQVEALGGNSRDAERWVGVGVRDRLGAACGLSTTLYNDGKAACWGELAAMKKPRPGTFACYLVSTFIPCCRRAALGRPNGRSFRSGLSQSRGVRR